MKKKWVFTDDRGDGGLAEAARFVGMFGGCVPNSREWKLLKQTIVDFPSGDAALEEAYREALDLLRGRA